MSLDYGNRLKLKICLVGDGAVGKTSLVRKFVFDEFSEKYLTTIGTKISKREMTMPDPDGGVGVDIDMAIWDIIGQHGFRRLLQEAYFFGVDGIIAVCDMTRVETLSGLEDWLQRVEEVAGSVPIIAAVNKSDLQTHRNIEEPDLREMMKKFNAEFLLTSAKTGENVEELFDYLANVIVEQRRAKKKEGALSSRPEAKET